LAKKVIIIHGWADNPTRGWISWLVQELANLHYLAIAPKMPNPIRPNLKRWITKLNQIIGDNLTDTILVGHSLGCFVLLRFLEQKNLTGKLDKLILVSGFIQPKNSAYQKYFLPEPDFNLIQSRAKQIYGLYSNNDNLVLPSQTKQLANKLSAKLLLDKDKGHFLASHGINKLPKLLHLITNS